MTRRDFALPGTRAQYAPDSVFDLRHIRIAVDLDLAERRVRGVCTLTLAARLADQRAVVLDAVELDIQRVTRDGEPCEFRHDGKALHVDLDELEPPPVGAPFDIEVTYAGQPRRGMYFVGPDQAYPDKPTQVWTQGQDRDSRYWFPCFDTPHVKATSEVVATVPVAWFALSNGDLIGDRVDGARRTLHWRLDVPHSCYLITLAAGALTELRDAWQDVDVLYYVTPGREDEARRTLGRTPDMLDLFSRLFGVRYPYTKYAQVFVADFIFGGMENTSATTLTDVILLDERAAIDYDADALIAHELAHQWFGDLITCRDWGEGWLNEGFATYAEYLWREHAEGRDAADVELADWGQQYFGEDSRRYRRTVATKLYDEPIDIFDHHLYEKGGRVLHMLRQILGDDGFWAAIRHYLETHRTGSVETRDLTRAVEAATGRALDWFFEQWITDSAGHPELKVSYRWDGEQKLAQITVAQTQKVEGATPLFRLPTQIRFRVPGADGSRDLDRPIEITEDKQTFFFALPAEPEQAIFDPGKALLCTLERELPIPMICAELADATCAIDRAVAAAELGKRGGHKPTDALTEALRADPFWGVRAAVAGALGRTRTDRARDALLDALAAEPHPKARRAVVRALGAFVGDAAVGDALADFIERGDDSYFVEAEACLALGKTRSARAPATLRAAAQRDSLLDRIRQFAYRGLVEARDDTAATFLADATTYGRVSHGRVAAIGALGTLVRGRRDRDARDARELAERLLDDRDYRVQGAAIEALGTIGDPAAVPALQRLIDRTLDGRLRRRAREVVRDIHSGAGSGEAMSALRDEVETLRIDAGKLRERVDKLETLLASRHTSSKSKKSKKSKKSISETGKATKSKLTKKDKNK